MVVNEFIGKCYERTLGYIKWNLKCEVGVFTLNEHYFQDYKTKFLTHYRGSRQKGLQKSLMQTLEVHDNSLPTIVHGVDQRPVTKVLTGLRDLGISAKVMDIPKMLETDPFEPALEIMASVRAYFQGNVTLCRFPVEVSGILSSCVQAVRRQRTYDNRPRIAAWIGLESWD